MKVEAVIKVVSERYGVSEEEIVGRPGERKIGKPQQIALFLSRKETSQSLLEIAQAFNRTHASVILNVKHVARMMESDEHSGTRSNPFARNFARGKNGFRLRRRRQELCMEVRQI